MRLAKPLAVGLSSLALVAAHAVVQPQPAAAAVRCSYTSCDGLNPYGRVSGFTPCDADDYIAKDVRIREDITAWNVRLEVHRSPACRAQWTEVAIYYAPTNCSGEPCKSTADAARRSTSAGGYRYVSNSAGSTAGSVRQFSSLIGASGDVISHKGCYDTGVNTYCAWVDF